MASSDITWIGVDWGTSNFRAYALDNQNAVLDSMESSTGMRTVEKNTYESVLTSQILPWIEGRDQVPVLMSGMVGARQGWLEAPYRSTPCGPPDVQDLTPVPVSDNRLRVFIAPGVSQSDPADVMRGEETQILGLLAQRPDFNGIVCLPGTHSKWVKVSSGEITLFRTWMTGELFEVLSQHTVLQHSVNKNAWCEESFATSARSMLQSNEQILGSLFSTRASDLLHQTGKDESTAALSGRLIGAECREALEWLPETHEPIVLIGSEELTRLYSVVIEQAGRSTDQLDVASATLSGLQAVSSAVIEQGVGNA